MIAVSRRPVQYSFKDEQQRLKFVSVDQYKESADFVAQKLAHVGGNEVSIVLFYTYIAK